MEYKMIVGQDSKELTKLLNKHAQEGWIVDTFTEVINQYTILLVKL